MVERLGKNDYSQIISLMNEVFTRQNKREMDFEREIPKMCVRDEEHMRKHFGVRENGRLVACLGVYPFETVVAGETMLFATMGNVVTHWDYEGKGYMSEMLNRGVEELSDINADVVRLTGLRSRYNRYGFEQCGQNYHFIFTQKNRERKFPNFQDDITFKKMDKEDMQALAFAVRLYNQNEIAATRSEKTVYDTLTAVNNTPYIALRGGEKIGYLAADATTLEITEMFSMDNQAFCDMLCAWQKYAKKTVGFFLQPHQIDLICIFTAICESTRILSPCQFWIRNWDKVVDAFIKLKSRYAPLPVGEWKIGIDGYGTIKLFATTTQSGCVKTDETPNIRLDRLSAARYIFGPYPPVYTANVNTFAQACLPLPLSWNSLDKV